MRTRLATSSVVCAACLIVTPGVGQAAPSDCPNANATPDQVSVTTYADSLLCVVNQTRLEWGRDELSMQRNLIRAGEWQADDMVQEGYFSHTQPDGDTLADRLDRANFIPSSDHWRAGENLAAGHDSGGTPAAIVWGWMQSREHRINLLDPGFTMAGIGVTRGWPGTTTAQNDSMTVAMEYGWRAPVRR
jgi:uncharacterized protein YkwD